MTEKTEEIKVGPRFSIVFIERPRDICKVRDCDGWEVESNGNLVVRKANGGKIEIAAGHWSSVDGRTGAILYEEGKWPRELSPEEAEALKAGAAPGSPAC